MARLLYTALFYLSLPLIVARLWWRGRRAPAYRQRIAERFGYFSQQVAPSGIWVHAVSVGEVIAAASLVRALLQRHPNVPITITTMTPTGSERVRDLFSKELLTHSVFHVYAPYDVPHCLARFLQRVQPRLLIIIETELWPNTVHACAMRNIPVVLANARLSEKSARGYGRFRALTTPMLRELDKVVAQNADDGARFVALGLPQKNLAISGSIKFDISLDAELMARAQQMRVEWRSENRFTWIAASTHVGEDEIVLQAHRQLRAQYPDALLILVPRHPERFNDVAAFIEKNNFAFVRRSAGPTIAGDCAVLLGDTMGELLFLLGCADCAFVGGSLIARGGHNTLEPAAWGLPIITGPSDFNFREISALLQRDGALKMVANENALAGELIALAGNAELRSQRGGAAKQVVAANRGALEKLIREIEGYL
ncbi:MAG: lipid IV(A) 3-deoxy-D-manno-octulosonic acid transferase [Spongiibacteraceae bacterium]